jgi:Phage ABA sandwich domain
MNKTEAIARRILGWKLNRWDRWFDFENRKFIPVSDFQPDKNLDHAMLIVKKLEQFGYTFTKNGDSEVRFNHVGGAGANLAEAITDAAYSIADTSSLPDGWV